MMNRIEGADAGQTARPGWLHRRRGVAYAILTVTGDLSARKACLGFLPFLDTFAQLTDADRGLLVRLRSEGWWARQDSNLQQHGYEPWVLTN